MLKPFITKKKLNSWVYGYDPEKQSNFTKVLHYQHKNNEHNETKLHADSLQAISTMDSIPQGNIQYVLNSDNL